MRILLLTLIAVATTSTGCRHHALRSNTLSMASTLTDLQYRMVLNNLAMLLEDADLLPWHVKIDDGDVQIEDKGRLQVEVSPLTSDLEPLAGGLAERRQTQRWGLVPVTNPKELRDPHALYRRTMGREIEGNATDEIKDVPENWFRTGPRGDVPPNARHVGRWRNRYAWVRPGRTRNLTEFTLSVLSVVRLKPDDRGFDRGIIPGRSD